MQDHVQAYFRRVKSFTHLHSVQIVLRPSCRLNIIIMIIIIMMNLNSMIMILFADEISLYFTRLQSNRLKSNNKQAIAAVHGPHSLVR